jgi:polyhydroxyalkanoate synthesis regulator phasin
MVSDVVTGLSSVAQPVRLDSTKDVQEIVERLRSDLDNLCQKVDCSIHNLISKQENMLKDLMLRSDELAHRQQQHIEQLEVMILQLSEEIKKQSK